MAETDGEREPRKLSLLAPKPFFSGSLPSLHSTVGDQYFDPPDPELRNPRRRTFPELIVPGFADYSLDHIPVKEYTICNKIYTMQQPPKNEGFASFQRHTVDGRHLEYKLEVVQQPEKARACGSGPRSSADRRPVDPPPVVKLTVFDITHPESRDITLKYEGGFMLFAGLEFARPIANGRMHQNSHVIPVLTGVCVAGAAYLQKPSEAAYFIFPDLSVRHEGWYRLRFHLFEQIKRPGDADRDHPHPRDVNTPSTVEKPTAPLAHESMANRIDVYSAPFQVFSAKKFPGLNTSTDLSKMVADQGCRVRIRRDIRQRKGPMKKGKDSIDDDQQSILGTPGPLIHSRSLSRDSLDRHQLPVDPSHRVSMDNLVTYGHHMSQNTSRDQSAMPSPLAVVPPLIRRPTLPMTSPMTPYSSTSYGGHSTTSAYQQGRSYTPIQNSSVPRLQHNADVLAASSDSQQDGTSLSLPSIRSFFGEEAPRLAPGGYKLPSPVAKKRAYSPQSPVRDLVLKDGARPDRSTFGSSIMSSNNWLINSGNPKSVIGNANQIMEADTDLDHDGSDSEVDPVLDGPLQYKRAAGYSVPMEAYMR